MKFYLLLALLLAPNLLQAHPSIINKSQDEILNNPEAGVAEILAILEKFESRVAKAVGDAALRNQEEPSLDFVVHGPITTAAYILVHANWKLSPEAVNPLAEKLNDLIARVQNGVLSRYTENLYEIRTLLYSRQDGLPPLEAWSDFGSKDFLETISAHADLDYLRTTLFRKFLRRETQSLYLAQAQEVYARRLSGFPDLDSTYDHWDVATVQKIHDNIWKSDSGENIDARYQKITVLNLGPVDSTTEVVRSILEAEFKRVLVDPNRHSIGQIEVVLRLISYRVYARESLSPDRAQIYSDDLLKLAGAYVYFGQTELAKRDWGVDASAEARERNRILRRIQNGAREIIVKTGLVSDELLEQTLETHETLKDSGFSATYDPDHMPMPFEIAFRALENQIRDGQKPDVRIIRYILLYPSKIRVWDWEKLRWEQVIHKLIPIFELFDDSIQKEMISAIGPEIQSIINETNAVREWQGWFKFKKFNRHTEEAKRLRRALRNSWPNNPFLASSCPTSISALRGQGT